MWHLSSTWALDKMQFLILWHWLDLFRVTTAFCITNKYNKRYYYKHHYLKIESRVIISFGFPADDPLHSAHSDLIHCWYKSYQKIFSLFELWLKLSFQKYELLFLKKNFSTRTQFCCQFFSGNRASSSTQQTAKGHTHTKTVLSETIALDTPVKMNSRLTWT